MSMLQKFLIVGVLCPAVVLMTRGRPVQGQNGVALSGTVIAKKDGKLEGVLVTARRDGANFSVTVISNEQGAYSFPATHLAPGKYVVAVRADGYDLVGTNPSVGVSSGRVATLDLTIDAAKDVSSQVSTTEWLMTIPGTDEQKAMLQKTIMSCSYCHSLERVLKSRHNA